MCEACTCVDSRSTKPSHDYERKYCQPVCDGRASPYGFGDAHKIETARSEMWSPFAAIPQEPAFAFQSQAEIAPRGFEEGCVQPPSLQGSVTHVGWKAI